MRHLAKSRRFGRLTAHRQSMLANLAIALIEHERISTTIAKAKDLRKTIDKLITWAKNGDLHSRRLALSIIPQKEIIAKLFGEIAPRFTARNGGYTRIFRTSERKGDGASLSIIEFVEKAKKKEKKVKKEAKKLEETKKETKPKDEKKEEASKKSKDKGKVEEVPKA